jgi:hypothetical protein
VRESLFGRIRNRSRSQAKGDKRTEGIEPRSYIPGASVDPTEARNTQYNAVEKWFRIDEKAWS